MKAQPLIAVRDVERAAAGTSGCSIAKAVTADPSTNRL